MVWESVTKREGQILLHLRYCTRINISNKDIRDSDGQARGPFVDNSMCEVVVIRLQVQVQELQLRDQRQACSPASPCTGLCLS